MTTSDARNEDGARRLSGRHVVITGGASGIGLATAKMFMAEGARVALLDLDEARGAQAGRALGCPFVRVDVTREESARAAVAEAADHLGAIDGLVNSAGVVQLASLRDT